MDVGQCDEDGEQVEQDDFPLGQGRHRQHTEEHGNDRHEDPVEAAGLRGGHLRDDEGAGDVRADQSGHPSEGAHVRHENVVGRELAPANRGDEQDHHGGQGTHGFEEIGVL